MSMVRGKCGTVEMMELTIALFTANLINLSSIKLFIINESPRSPFEKEGERKESIPAPFEKVNLGKNCW